MLAKDFTYDYLALPLNDRILRDMDVGVIEKEIGDLLPSDYDNMMIALEHLFNCRHMPHAMLLNGKFPSRAFMHGSFHHYVRKASHIYFTFDGHKGDVLVGYMLADKNVVLDLFVAESYRRDRLASGMVNMLIWKNKEPEQVLFHSNSMSEYHDALGFFNRLDCKTESRQHGEMIGRFTKVLTVKTVVKHNEINKTKAELDALGIAYDIKEDGIMLNGKFNANGIALVDKLYKLYFGEE